MNRVIAFSVTALVLTGIASPASAESAAQAQSSCVACHLQLDDELLAPVSTWERDVHFEVGLGCAGCHGGDPSPGLADDAEAAMSPSNGFRPSPDRLHVAKFCGNCHSDAAFMRQYDPQGRVDQLAEYRTSVHGKLNAQGDPVPATCIDCHGVHGIRRVSLPDSPVFPSNVPATCANCHADAAVMEPYGIPTDQFEEYMESAHAAALLERQDTAAPACNDCHGNHGAAPPGVQSVANVCGQCHGREARLFRASFKKELFDSLEVGECSVCHGNHRVTHPTAEMIRNDSAPSTSVGRITGLAPLTVDLGELDPGGSAEIVWTTAFGSHIDLGAAASRLPVVISAWESDPLKLSLFPGTVTDDAARRADNGNLAATLAVEPPAGEPVKPGDAVRYRLRLEATGNRSLAGVRVVGPSAPGTHVVEGSVCLSCHSPGDECDQLTEQMYGVLSATNRELREAENLLHQAEIAGMHVSEVQFDLNSRGTTVALDARALIHTFDPEQVVARSAEAQAVAAEALAAGHQALAELQFRRRGLAVSLVLIGLVLVGLFLKIRDVDRRTGRSDAGQAG